MRGRMLMLAAGRRMGEQQAQQQAKQQGAVEARASAPPASAAPTKDVTTELRKLADLHKSDVLTDEEFTAAKKKTPWLRI